MSRARRQLRRRLAITAFAPLFALAPAASAGARVSLQPDSTGAGSGVSLRLADASHPPVAANPAGSGVSLRLADASHPPVADVRATAAPRGTAVRAIGSPDDSGLSAPALALLLSGVAVLAAGAATVTLRSQGRHSAA